MRTVDIDSKYDSWAKIYNQYWGLEYCKHNLPPFEKLLKQYNILPSAKLLDLCCGTGQMAQNLIEQGYQVTGLDISESMLNYACKNAPDATFILDDARFFNLPSSFNAVISPSCSLNHIMSIEELKEVFMRVYDALLNNGVFLFGLNLEDGYKSWNGSLTDGDVQDNYAWACCDSYNAEDQTAQFKITIFELVENIWQRLDITNLVKPYAPAEIITALKSVGFTNINVYNRQGNLADDECNRFAIFAGFKFVNK